MTEPQDPDGVMAKVADFGLSRALAYGQVGDTTVEVTQFNAVIALLLLFVQSQMESAGKIESCEMHCSGFTGFISLDSWFLARP